MKDGKIDQEGQACRHCGTPVVRRQHKNGKGKPKRPGGYFFEWWFACPNKKCRALYMVEEAQRFASSSDPGKDAYDALPAVAFIAPKKKKRRKSRFWQRYEDYINSAVWLAFRKMIISERHNRCEECGASGETESLHLHHLNYKHFGCEKRTDVKLLCGACHQAKHPNKRIKIPRRKKAA